MVNIKAGRTTLLQAMALCLWLAGGLRGGIPVLYTLEAGSQLTDECLACGRMPIVVPLAGTFTLSLNDSTQAGIFEFELSGLDAAGSVESLHYEVKGSGTYTRRGEDLAGGISLEIAVNDVAGVKISGGPAPQEAPWPALDVNGDEDGSRDPFHRFRIRLVASPHPEKWVEYQIEEGSYFIDDCLHCGRPTIPVPIVGRFRLGKFFDIAPFARYAIAGLEITNRSGDPTLSLTGGGSHQQFQEFARLQTTEILLSDGKRESVLRSAQAAETADFPDLEVDLAEENPPKILSVWSLHLVAAPVLSAATPFRRGDANADGTVNLSDAIAILFWLFQAAGDPPCLEAVDGNGDGKGDLADVSSILAFLFEGGKPPPAPGPVACGVEAEGPLGCLSFGACR